MIIDEGRTAEYEYSDYSLDLEAWAAPKPFGISGCFRLRNETEFMAQSVISHLPWLDEAVLVVQPSEDRTLDLANELADRYDKVRMVFYPWVPYQIDTPEHFQEPPNSVKHMVHMSNFALTQCRYSWIAKTEGDVIALPTFGEIRAVIEKDPDLHRYYGRVILNIAGHNGELVSATNPRNHGWDEAVFNNHPSWHFVRHEKWESIQHWEFAGDNVNMGWSALHTKRCKKKYADGWNDEMWLPFDRENVQAVLRHYNMKHDYPASDDPLGIDDLYEAKGRWFDEVSDS